MRGGLLIHLGHKVATRTPSHVPWGFYPGKTPQRDCAKQDKSEDCSPGWSGAKAVERWMPPGCASWTLRLLTALAPDHPGLQSSLLSSSAQSFPFVFFFGRPPCNSPINLKLSANERSLKVTLEMCHRQGDSKNIWRQKTPKTDFLRTFLRGSLRGLCGV